MSKGTLDLKRAPTARVKTRRDMNSAKFRASLTRITRTQDDDAPRVN